jgi:hypothetical protein
MCDDWVAIGALMGHELRYPFETERGDVNNESWEWRSGCEMGWIMTVIAWRDVNRGCDI